MGLLMTCRSACWLWLGSSCCNVSVRWTRPRHGDKWTSSKEHLIVSVLRHADEELLFYSTDTFNNTVLVEHTEVNPASPLLRQPQPRTSTSMHRERGGWPRTHPNKKPSLQGRCNTAGWLHTKETLQTSITNVLYCPTEHCIERVT